MILDGLTTEGNIKMLRPPHSSRPSINGLIGLESMRRVKLFELLRWLNKGKGWYCYYP